MIFYDQFYYLRTQSIKAKETEEKVRKKFGGQFIDFYYNSWAEKIVKMFVKLCKNIRVWRSAEKNYRNRALSPHIIPTNLPHTNLKTLPKAISKNTFRNNESLKNNLANQKIQYPFSTDKDKPSQKDSNNFINKPSVSEEKKQEKTKEEKAEETHQQIMEKIKIIAGHDKEKELLTLLQKHVKSIEAKKQAKIDPTVIAAQRFNWFEFLKQKFGTFGTAVLASLALTLFLMNWLIEHPAVYEELMTNLKVYDEQLQNEVTIQTLIEKLRISHELWHSQHDFLKIIDKQVAKATDIVFPTKFYPENKRLRIIESCTHSYLPECFLLDFFELENFEQLVKNEQLFYVQLKRTSQFEGWNDPLRKLKILTNHIYKKIQQTEKPISIPFKSTIFSSLDIRNDEQEENKKQQEEPNKILLIIDNFEELAEQMQNDKTKNAAIDLFNKIKYISKSKYVNIVAIGYNSIFTDTIVQSAGVKPHEVKTSTVYLKQEKFRSIITRILQDHKKQLINYLCQGTDKEAHQNLNFKDIITQIGANATNMQSFVKLLKFLKKMIPKQLQELEKNEKGKSWEERNKQIISMYFVAETTSRKEHLINEVFKGSKKERETKIRLLSKMLLDSYNLKDWDDRDLIALKLDDKEFQTYQELSKEHILFYFNFYYEQYKSIYYRLLKRKKYLYELYQEEENRLKQQQK